MLVIDPLELTWLFPRVFQSKTEKTMEKEEAEEDGGDKHGDEDNEDEDDDAKILTEKRCYF